MVFIHGFSDHANRYKDFFPKLNAAGILVHSFDQRGWGRSVKQDSQKGLTGTTQQVLSDITSVIQSHLPSPVPLFLMGHSMGGQETLYFAAEGPDEVKNQLRGFIVMSPLIRLHPGSEPNRVTVMAGRLVGRLLPSRQMISKLDAGFMSHDDALNKDWEADELCHDTGTLEGLAGMLSRGEELDRGKVVIKDRDGLHMLLAHGTEDKVTSHEATKKLFGERLNIKNKTLKLYEGNYHCRRKHAIDPSKS